MGPKVSGKPVTAAAARGSTFDETSLRACCRQYNMIDVEMVVAECKKNPGAEGKGLGTVKHHALSQGRDNVKEGKLNKANANFALAYQARCVADYIFVNIVGGKITDKKKRTHAHYLTLSRDFGKYCSNPSSFTAVKKDEVLKLIKDIVDDGG